MKLRLPHKFQAALMAALASVSFTTLSTGAAYAEETPLTFGADLGDVMYVGDSITHGIAAASWRWSMHKIFVDNGIAYDENGYNTGNDSGYSGGLQPGTPYGGVAFENVHSAHSGGDAYEVIGRAKRSGGHYGNSNIYNWLGKDTQLTVRGSSTGSYTGTVTDHVDNFLMLIGTNDLLSTYQDQPTVIAGSASDALVTDINNIYGVMQDTNPGSKLVLLSIPCWTDHGNNNSTEVHQAVVTANDKLQAWADSQTNVTYVDVNPGLIDVASSTPFKGVRSFYRNPTADGLHPNAQGELIIAGNVAKAMGYAGRSVGLERADAQHPAESVWTTNTSVSVTSTAQTVQGAEFSIPLGYTVDFSTVYGNGNTDSTWDNDHAFSITVGDGTHSGTLSLTEAYVKWGDKILYSRDNSESGNFRIAYVNTSINASDNVTAGYYVWLGDQLIGEGLNAGTAGFNGIKLQSTGVDTILSTLSWTNAAYAPTTTGYYNASEAFKLVQVNPSPSHDNPVKVQEDFTGAEVSTTLIAASAFEHPEQKSSTSANASGTGQWFAGANALGASGYTGNLALEITGSAGGNAIFGIVHSGKTSRTVKGDVTMQMSSTGTITHSTNGASSIVGGYYGSITGKFRAVVNSGTLQYGITGGYHVANDGDHIGSVEIDINGGSVQGNVYGGSINTANGKIDGNIDIIVTGGTVTGSIIGTGTTGTIDGDSISITLTGGVVTGDVLGRNAGFTGFTGTTSVTVDGSLAYIGGDISADIVTVNNVASSPEHYTDRFDSYRGTITADKVVLNNYTVEQMLANIETKSLVLQGNSSTTIHNLTLTACDIHVDAGSSLILDGVNTYGNTATYNGHVAIADGTTFNLTNAEMVEGSETHYSDGEDGFVSGTFYVLKQATDEDTISGSDLYGTGGSPLSAANTETFIGAGILSGATFTYVAGDGTGGGSLQATGGGTGGDYFVNTDNVVYSSTSEDYHAYSADSIRLNGGTLNVRENLKSGTTITVGAADSGLNLAAGTFVNATALTYDTGVSGFALSGEGELILTAANAEQMLTTVTGDGTMHLVETAVLNGEGASASAPKASLSSGTLIVGNGSGNTVQMKIGRTATGGSYVANYATIKSFQHVTLDKGELWFHTNSDNDALTVNGLTVTENGGSIHLEDVNAASTIKLAGTTNLQGDLTFTNNWKANTLDVEKLTGSGDFTVTVNHDSVALNLRDVTGWSGTMDLSTGGGKTHVIQGDSSLMSFRQGSGTGTYNFGTQNSTANFNGLTFEGTSAQVNIYTTSAAQNIHTNKLTLGSGMTLTAYYGQFVSAEGLTTKLVADTLQLLGDATIKTTQHGGYMEFGSITGSGTLTIQHTAGSTIRDTVSVGGNPDVDSATFTGKLLINEDNTGNGRGIFVVLNDKLTMSQAQLELKAQNTGGTRYVGVGINADLVQLGALIDGDNVGSLTAYTLFSGDASGSAVAQTYSGYGSRGGMRTLEITGAGGTSSIKVLNNISLAMSGSGTQTFTGDMSQFNGSINVTNGTLNLTPNSAIATHEVEVETGGALTITTTGNNAITAFGTMVNDGTLNLNGTVALNSSDLSAFQKVEGSGSQTTYSGKDTYAGSGFLVSSAEYYLVKGNGTLTGSVTIDENTGTKVSQDDNSIIVTFKPNETGGLYYVNDNFTYDAEEMGNASGLVIAKGATLTTNSVSDVTNKVLHGSGSYAALNRSDGGPWSAANGYGLGAGVSLGTDWTGTVVVSGGAGNNQMMNLDILGNNGLATVEIKGLVGWSQNWNGTIAANIKLTDVGSTVAWSNSASTQNSATATFTGRWSGEGTFKRTGNNNINYTYTGDISEWTGKFDMNGGTTTLTFAGSSNVVNATIVKTGGTLTVVADTDVQFNEDISASGFTVNAGKTATMAANATISGGTTNNGNLVLRDGTTYTVHATSDGQAQALGNIVVEKSATIVDNNYNATMNFTTITGGEDATLTLLSSHSNTTSEWNLGVAGQTQATPFGGKLVLMAERDLNNNRAANFNFVDGTMFSGAEVQIKNGTDVTNYTLTNTLKLKAANVTIGGLSDAAAGMVTDKRKWSVANGTGQGSAILTLNGSDTYTSDIKLESGVNLAMNGTGTQAFTGDLSAMDGAVSVSAGTLTLNNKGTDRGHLDSVSVTGGTLNLNNMNVDGTTEVTGGMLNLTSSVETSGLTVATGTTLKLAGENELTVNGLLTLQTGATLDLANIFASPVQQPVLQAAPKSNGPLSIDGDSGLLSGGLLGAVEPADGATYVLATANEIDLASSGINLQNIAAGYTGELSTRTATGGSDQELILTLAALSTDLIWDQHTNSNWSTDAADKNWHADGGSDGTAYFTQTANVTFKSGVTNTPVLQTDIEAGTMTIDANTSVTVNTSEYNLTVDNLVATNTSNLTKTGTGTATFGGDANTPVSLGTLTVSGGTANFEGGPVTANTFTTSGADTIVKFDEKVTVTGPRVAINFNWDATSNSITFAKGLEFTGSGTNGYAMAIGNGDTVMLGGESDFHDKALGIAGGQNNATGKLVLLKDATLSLGRTWNTGTLTQNGAVELQDGSVLNISGNGGASTISKLSGSGTVNVNAQTLQLVDFESFTGDIALANTGALDINATNFGGKIANNGTGTVTMYGRAGQVANEDARIAVTKNNGQELTLISGSEKAISKVTVANGSNKWLFAENIPANDDGLYTDIEFLNTGSTQNGLIVKPGNVTANIGSLSAVSSNTTVRGDYNDGGTRVLAVHQNTNTTFAGQFVDNDARSIGLDKYGTGTLTLTAANGSESALNIYAGAIKLDGADAKWTGATTVHGGGTLALTSSVTNLANTVSIDDGGTLTLGSYKDSAVMATNLTLASGSILDLSNLSFTGDEKGEITLINGGAITVDNLGGVVLNFSDQSLKDRATLSKSGNNLVLTFTQPEPGRDLIWDGTNGNSWTTDSNWHEDGGDDGSAVFQDGDNVAFTTATPSVTTVLGDAANAGTMEIDNGVAVTVNTNAKNLTVHDLDVEGGSLTKTGTGKATFGGSDTEGVSLSNLSIMDGSAEFSEHVTVTGNRVNVAYAAQGAKTGVSAEFKDGLDYEGSDSSGYAMVIGYNNSVVLGSGSESDLGDNKSLAIARGATLELKDGATASVGRVYNSTIADNNGTLKLGEGSTFSITNPDASSSLTNIVNNGGTLNVKGNLTVFDAVSGDGDIVYDGTTGKKMQLNGGGTMGDVTVNGGEFITTGEQAITMNSLTVTGGTAHVGNSGAVDLGDVNLTGGNLVLNTTVSAESLTTTSGATLTFAGAEMLTTTGDIDLSGGLQLDLSNITYRTDTSAVQTITLATTSGAINLDGGTFTFLNTKTDVNKTSFTLRDDGANHLVLDVEYNDVTDWPDKTKVSYTYTPQGETEQVSYDIKVGNTDPHGYNFSQADGGVVEFNPSAFENDVYSDSHNIVMHSDTTIVVEEGKTVKLTGLLQGNGTGDNASGDLTKAGAGTLEMEINPVAVPGSNPQQNLYEGSVDVEEGTLHVVYKNTGAATNRSMLAAGKDEHVRVAKGATLELDYKTGISIPRGQRNDAPREGEDRSLILSASSEGAIIQNAYISEEGIRPDDAQDGGRALIDDIYELQIGNINDTSQAVTIELADILVASVALNGTTTIDNSYISITSDMNINNDVGAPNKIQNHSTIDFSGYYGLVNNTDVDKTSKINSLNPYTAILYGNNKVEVGSQENGGVAERKITENTISYKSDQYKGMWLYSPDENPLSLSVTLSDMDLPEDLSGYTFTLTFEGFNTSTILGNDFQPIADSDLNVSLFIPQYTGGQWEELVASVQAMYDTDSGNTVFKFEHVVVPEPTTGTLSLLALAALAARRRRK